PRPPRPPPPRAPRAARPQPSCSRLTDRAPSRPEEGSSCRRTRRTSSPHPDPHAAPRRMRRAGLLLLLAGCVHAWPAAASEESQALSARGLIELNAGRNEQALELFDRAVAADPA